MKRAFLLVFLFPLFAFAQRQESMTVYFRFDEYELEPVFQNQLDSFFHDKPVQHIFIEGHCDSIGSIAYNDVLSSRRARAVKNHILSSKFDDTMISVKAMGKRFPLNGNMNEEERRLNRRAEIKIITGIEQKKELIPPVAHRLEGDPGETDTTTGNVTAISSIESAEVGATIKLENINFYGGRHIWLPRSEKTLKRLLLTMKENPSLVIEIQGHICCIPSGDGPDFDDNNRNVLSVNRAKAIYEYLIQNSIEKSRLSYKGFGADSKLVWPENTEAERESNRRVEIKIMKK